MADTCPTCGADVRVAGDGLTKHYEPTLADRVEELEGGESLRDRIEDALLRYRCAHTEHGELGEGLPLVDALTPPKESSIRLGRVEVGVLADYLEASLAAPDARQREGERGEDERWERVRDKWDVRYLTDHEFHMWVDAVVERACKLERERLSHDPDARQGGDMRDTDRVLSSLEGLAALMEEEGLTKYSVRLYRYVDQLRESLSGLRSTPQREDSDAD